MAKKKKEEEIVDVNVYTPDEEKWQNEEEWATAKRVCDRFEAMKMARQTSCYWGEGAGELSDWDKRWSRDEKLKIMWRADIDIDDPRSNLKSPMSWGACQAIGSEFLAGKIKPTIRWTEEKDKPKAVIKEATHQYVQDHRGFDKEYADGFDRLTTKGTNVFYVTYLLKQREVQVWEHDAKKMTEEQKKDLKKNKKPVLKTEIKTDYDDVVITPIRIEEFYMDEFARCLRGKFFEARDCVWCPPMTPDQIRAEFENSNDPFVIKENLAKIKPASSYTGDNSFFKPPTNIAEDQAQPLRYYNKAKDEYIVVVGDIPIRIGPSPHPHKELPFALGTCFPFLDHPYGISIPAILEGLQSEDETLRNLALDQLKIIVNPPVLVQQSIYGELVDTYPRMEPGMRIPVREKGDVTYMQRSQPVYELDTMGQRIREDGVIASGIDPRRQGMTGKNATATDAMLDKEAYQKIMKKIIERYIESIQDALWLADKEMNAHYTVSRVKEMVDEKEPKRNMILRKIRLKNKKMNYDGGELKITPIKGFSSFELKEDYFNFKEDYDILIDPEVIVQTSKGLEMRSSEQALSDLTPFAGDPANVPPGQPKPPINLIEILRWYAETHNIPEKIFDEDEIDVEEEIDRAIKQNQEMQQLKRVSPIPGEHPSHMMVHTIELEQITPLVQNPMPDMKVGEILKLQQYQQLLASHLQGDAMPKGSPVQAQAPAQLGAGGQGGPSGSGPTMGPAGGMASQPGSPMGGTQGPTQQQVMGTPKPQPQAGIY